MRHERSGRLNVILSATIGMTGLFIGVVLAVLLYPQKPVSSRPTEEPAEPEGITAGKSSAREGHGPSVNRLPDLRVAPDFFLPAAVPRQSEDLDPATAIDRDALARRAREAYQDRLQRHETEARSATFSEKVEPMLATGLGQLESELGFKTMSVDCRSTSCIAMLEFRAGEAESVAYENIVQRASFGTGCARTIVLPEETLPGQPITAPLLFECAGWQPEL